MRGHAAFLLVALAACSGQPAGTESLRPLQTFRFSGRHADGALSVTFIDGDRRAISSGVDDTASPLGRRPRNRNEAVHRIEVSFSIHRDCFERLLCADSGPRRHGALLDPRHGKDIFTAASKNAATVALSPDGKLAAAGGQDTSIEIWNVPDGKETSRFSVDAAVIRIAFSGGVAIRVVLADGRVCTGKLSAGGTLACVSATSDPVSQAAFSADARRVLIGGRYGELLLWDAERSDPIRKLNAGSGDIVALAISNAGSEALSGGSDKTVRLWNLKSGAQIASTAAPGSYVSCAAFSSDGSRALFGSDDGTIALWRLK